MRFDPKSEEECKNFALLDPGDYSLVVIEAENKTSKAGNDMIELVLEYQGEPRCRIWDYLLSTTNTMYKLRHFCEAAGFMDKYEDGSLVAADCIGAMVVGCVKIAKGKGEYSDKNSIADYRAPTTQTAIAGAHQPVPEDDIPF